MPDLRRVAALLDSTFARSNGSVMPQELGPGLYGTSLFFRANGAFHLFNVCNHWTARVLDAAGIPTAPVLATLPFGLLLDLRWRSGSRCAATVCYPGFAGLAHGRRARSAALNAAISLT